MPTDEELEALTLTRPRDAGERLGQECRAELAGLTPSLAQSCHCDRYSIGHIRTAECP